MFEFNNNDIFTGYLKQVLSHFNLPKIPVYTKQHQHYFDTYGVESPEILKTITIGSTIPKTIHYIPYIKDGALQEYIDGKWVKVGLAGSTKNIHMHYYALGDKIPNYTKTLRVNSNVYDTYTHEYLGDYLRFKRDFENINLMPLYNCFSNQLCDNVFFELKVGNGIVKFDSNDTAYKIYMLPLKMFKEYTIAIDSSVPVEFCCGLYNKYLDTNNKLNPENALLQHLKLFDNTYEKHAQMSFGKPILYKKLKEFCVNMNSAVPTEEHADMLDALVELAQNERDLKLFIKLPARNDSTIVVLEGDYTTWNNRKLVKNNSTSGVSNFYLENNHSIINLEPDILAAYAPIKLISPLQLLRYNTKNQHPFSDRLVEYLLENCITNSQDELYKNIQRVQNVIKNNESIKYKPLIYGMWDDNISKILYEYMSTSEMASSAFMDTLGFVDKDVEKLYNTRNSGGKKASLLSVELDEEGN